MYAVHSKSIDSSRISKCVFVGLPPEWARTNGFDIDGWMVDYAIPTTLIQNDHDPVASSEDIRKEQESGKFKNMTLVEVKGDDHMYGDFDRIRKYMLR